MGIELTDSQLYSARCDECDRYQPIGAVTAIACASALRNLGWRRYAYTPTAQHYLWACPKCKETAQ